MQFVSRERRSFIVRNDDRERERERDFVGNTPAHRHPLQLPLDGWLHLGENAIWNSAHFPVCRSSSRFRGSLPNVRTRKYLPLIKFTPRNAPSTSPFLTTRPLPRFNHSLCSSSHPHPPTRHLLRSSLLVCDRAPTLLPPCQNTLFDDERGGESREHFISIDLENS